MKRLFTFFTAISIITGFAARADSALKINEIDACTEYPRITVKFTIDVPENILSGISKEHFTLLEDGKAISQFDLLSEARHESEHHLIIAIDTSKSIPQGHFEKMKQSARALINTLSANDKVALVRFNDTVIQINGFSTDRTRVRAGISSLRRHGSKTLLYSAIYDSLENLRTSGGKNCSLFIFTDGKDEGSNIPIEDVIRLAKESAIRVHIICPAKQLCTERIARVARETGGSFASSVEIFNPAGARNSSVLQKASFSISYETRAPSDSKNHQIELRFAKGALSDRDFANFTISNALQPLKIPNLLDLLLAALIIILIILLALLIAIIVRNGNRLFQPVAQSASQETRHQTFFNGFDEKTPTSSAPTLTPHDPEFAYSKAWLVMKDGPNSGQKFPIFWDEISIGREETNAVVVSDQAVSLKHAKIKRLKDTYMLFDLVSENGTFLNGKKLLRPKTLCDWDEIKIGRTVFIFRGSKIKEA